MFWRRRKTADGPLAGIEAYTPQASASPNADTGTVSSADFRMTVQDVFSITGRGTVATGQIEQGQVRVGDALDVVAADGTVTPTTCTGVEMFRKQLKTATAGDNVGLLLKDLSRDQIASGAVLQAR